MGKKLIIVESPKKQKTIQKIFGKDFVVAATFGHICDLPSNTRGMGIDLEKTYRPRYAVIPDKKERIRAIQKAASSCDEVLVASDPDREGECIAYHIAYQLRDCGKPIKRIAFHEIKQKAIQHAIDNPVGFNEALYDAQQARRAIDRVVGFTVSPYVSREFGGSLSAGRVQSVALKMIVDRENEIDGFDPEVYFNISGILTKNSESIQARYPVRVSSEEKAKKIVADLNSDSFKVIDIKKKQNLRSPSPPFTTSVLQQEAYSKLKFKPDQTMKLAQELYEGGHITYLRTDSVTISEEALVEVRDYLTSKGFGIPAKPNKYQNKDAAQEAHEAIRPTDVNNTPDKIVLYPEQAKLYDLIWRTFVASQMESAVFDTVKVTIESFSGHKLLAEGKTLVNEGYLKIMRAYLKKDKDVVLPALSLSDSLLKKSIKLEKSQTKPPPRYNPGSLVAELERKTIGRPSTYATIINKITNRKYVKQTAAGFEATDIGKKLVAKLSDNFSFMDYYYTANMEKKLDEMAMGKIEYTATMKEFIESFSVEYNKASDYEGIRNKDAGFCCPKCGEKMIVRQSDYGYFAGCSGFLTRTCSVIVKIDLIDGKVVPRKEDKNDEPGIRETYKKATSV